MLKWKITYANVGEHEKLLVDGWEPFAVIPHVWSSRSQDSFSHAAVFSVHSKDIIYFRMPVEELNTLEEKQP